MTIATGQATFAFSNTAVNPLNLNAGVTTQATGSSFLVFTRTNSDSPTSVTDNKSNTYTKIGGPYTDTSDGFSVNVYLATNGTGGAGHTWAVNYSGTRSGSAHAVEITGGASTSLLDAIAGFYRTTSTPFSGPVTTTKAPDLIVGFIATGSGGAETMTSSLLTTSVSSNTNGANVGPSQVSCVRVTSASTYDPNWATTSGYSQAVVVTLGLVESGGAGGTRQGHLPLLGVAMAPLAWVIDRRSKLTLKRELSQDQKSRIFLPNYRKAARR